MKATAYRRWGHIGLAVLMALLALFTLWFVAHALDFGWRGLTRDLRGEERLFSGNGTANASIALHMITGAMITFIAPLQLIQWVRRKAAIAHRIAGRIILAGAMFTAVSGSAYMLQRGTIGGAEMTVAFSLYGLAMALCAVQTYRAARAKRWVAHQDWAVRLFLLCIASFLYRVHYGFWFTFTGGLGAERDFTGAFDRANIWAFYVPYLVVVELVLWRKGRGLFAARAPSK